MFYHMLGKHVGTLLVKTKTDDGEEEVHFEKSGNVGKNWNRLELNLDLKPGSKVNVDHAYGEQMSKVSAVTSVTTTTDLVCNDNIV